LCSFDCRQYAQATALTLNDVLISIQVSENDHLDSGKNTLPQYSDDLMCDVLSTGQVRLARVS